MYRVHRSVTSTLRVKSENLISSFSFSSFFSQDFQKFLLSQVSVGGGEGEMGISLSSTKKYASQNRKTVSLFYHFGNGNVKRGNVVSGMNGYDHLKPFLSMN